MLSTIVFKKESVQGDLHVNRVPRKNVNCLLFLHKTTVFLKYTPSRFLSSSKVYNIHYVCLTS